MQSVFVIFVLLIILETVLTKTKKDLVVGLANGSHIEGIVGTGGFSTFSSVTKCHTKESVLVNKMHISVCTLA